MGHPFKTIKNPDPQPFPGVVHDLTQETPKIIPATELPDAGRAHGLQSAREREMLIKGSQAELMDVCIRPKEQRLFAWKVWPVQFVGRGRVWRLAGGGVDLKGVGQLRAVKAPIPVRLGWYLLGAPIWHGKLLVSWLLAHLPKPSVASQE